MTEASANTGNLGRFCSFDPSGFRGGDDVDGRLGRVVGDVVPGSFERPAGDFSFDDARVGSSPSSWEQAME
jgi:hypothetical protein